MSREGTSDARAVVREGLRRVVAALGEPPHEEAPRGAWRNALLDETGSDRRGLVELLLRVHADGLASAIPRGPLDAAAWAPVRARLAFGYASAKYLDVGMARWAVDAWALALGVVAEDALAAEPPSSPAAVAPPPRTPNAGPGHVRPAASGGPVPSATPAAPPAGGRTPGRVRRAAARANAPPVHNPFPANFDRLAGWAFGGLFVAAAGAMWAGIATRREAAGVEVPRVEAGVHGAATPRVTRADDPDAAPRREPLGAAPSAAASSPAAVDTLRLRDGTVRTGRVERITRAAILLRDPWSDAVDAVRLDDVSELRARPGAALPIGGESDAPPRDELGRALPPFPLATLSNGQEGGDARTAGFGGRYMVRQALLDVHGTETCDAVATAVRQAMTRPTVEIIRHVPGDTSFALASRPGVHGTVDADGRFRTAPIRGARDGVQYWFRMSGRFGDGGFRAEAESATDAVLKFGSVQRCRVTSVLDARRLP